jgi:hypothetical protein
MRRGDAEAKIKGWDSKAPMNDDPSQWALADRVGSVSGSRQEIVPQCLKFAHLLLPYKTLMEACQKKYDVCLTGYLDHSSCRKRSSPQS